MKKVKVFLSGVNTRCDLLKSGTSHAFAEAKDVPGSAEDEDGVLLVGEPRLHFQVELDVVDS
jgi:hypothetical protein